MKFEDSGQFNFDEDWMPDDLKGSYCPNCFAQFFSSKIPKLQRFGGGNGKDG